MNWASVGPAGATAASARGPTAVALSFQILEEKGRKSVTSQPVSSQPTNQRLIVIAGYSQLLQVCENHLFWYHSLVFCH